MKAGVAGLSEIYVTDMVRDITPRTFRLIEPLSIYSKMHVTLAQNGGLKAGYRQKEQLNPLRESKKLFS